MLADARKQLETFWPQIAVVPGLSVRTLFDAILSELPINSGDNIIMSAINIENMADIARAHGLNIVPVDIDPDTLLPPPGALLRAHQATGAKVCVVSHLFGFVSPIPDARELGENGVLVIEDCAQAFAGDFHKGDANAGVSLFSFGPIKRRTALSGALAVIQHAPLASAISQRLNSYPALSESWYRKRGLKYLTLKLLTVPFFYQLLIWLLLIAGKNPDEAIGAAARGFSGPDLLSNIRHRPPARLLPVMTEQILETNDHQTRSTICTTFLDKAANADAHIGRHAEKAAFWLLPLLSAYPDAIVKALRKKGFDATQGATSLRVVGPGAPKAENLLRQVVYLPHPTQLSTHAQHKLATVFRNFKP